MDAHEIEAYLTELGQALAGQGIQQPLRLLMVGGAYMVTQIGSRQSTKDVDVLLENVPEPAVPDQQLQRASGVDQTLLILFP